MLLLIVLLAHVTMILIKSLLSKMHITTSEVANGAGLAVRMLPCIFIAAFLHTTFAFLKSHQYCFERIPGWLLAGFSCSCFLVFICHFRHWLGKVCFPVNPRLQTRAEEAGCLGWYRNARSCDLGPVAINRTTYKIRPASGIRNIFCSCPCGQRAYRC